MHLTVQLPSSNSVYQDTKNELDTMDLSEFYSDVLSNKDNKVAQEIQNKAIARYPDLKGKK